MSKRGEAVENSFLPDPLTLIAGNPGRRICLLYGSLDSWLFTGTFPQLVLYYLITLLKLELALVLLFWFVVDFHEQVIRLTPLCTGVFERSISLLR